MTAFEICRNMRHRLIAGDFNRLIKQIEAAGNSASNKEKLL
jgi:hypothetical protein